MKAKKLFQKYLYIIQEHKNNWKILIKNIFEKVLLNPKNEKDFDIIDKIKNINNDNITINVGFGNLGGKWNTKDLIIPFKNLEKELNENINKKNIEIYIDYIDSNGDDNTYEFEISKDDLNKIINIWKTK